MTPHLDIAPSAVEGPLIEAIIPRLEEVYNSVVATGAKKTRTGTLPGTDGTEKVWDEAAPEMNQKTVRALLPLVIVHAAMAVSNGQFSTYDGDAPDATVTVTCSALDALTARDLDATAWALLGSTMMWRVEGFTLHRVTSTGAPRIETRAQWPRIYHRDRIYNLTLTTNLNVNI